MPYSKEFLDKLRKQLPISKVVGRQVKLKRNKGGEWVGLSPFAPEKTPSFVVSDTKGFYHDFSTGKHGDIFSFIAETKRITFDEAVRELADLAVVELPSGQDFDRSQIDIRSWLRRQPHQIGLIYAARTALRAIPELARVLDLIGSDGRALGVVLLPTFRAASLSWVAAKQPHLSIELKDAAQQAADDAVDVARKVHPTIAGTVARAAAAAVRAAVDSAEVASARAEEIESNFASPTAYDNWSNRVANLGATADVVALMEGISPVEISRRRLWVDDAPPIIPTEWTRLETALHAAGDKWQVWTNWYRSRLGGLPENEKLERGIVSLPSAAWVEGPLFVNTKLTEMLREQPDKSPNKEPAPIENIASPFAFAVSAAGKVTLTFNSLNSPILPNPGSVHDHLARLEVCRTLAEDLCGALKARRFQARDEYLEGLEKYCSRLPSSVGEGNILLADAEVRSLRNLFAAEADILAVAFAAKLKTFLEQHIGLRVFYPEISTFYRDVQSGRITDPLPLDAVEGIVRSVSNFTPEVFESSISEALNESAEIPPVTAKISVEDLPAVSDDVLIPPRDPLGEVDPKKAWEFTFAGATNGLWRTFLEGEKIYKAVNGWKSAGDTLRPYVNEILDWLNRFLHP